MYRFDEKSAPYEVIENNSSHIYNVLFAAGDGIYFYNEETNKRERIGSNCFKGKPEYLTDNVFCDEDNMHF